MSSGVLAGRVRIALALAVVTPTRRAATGAGDHAGPRAASASISAPVIGCRRRPICSPDTATGGPCRRTGMTPG